MRSCAHSGDGASGPAGQQRTDGEHQAVIKADQRDSDQQEVAEEEEGKEGEGEGVDGLDRVRPSMPNLQ